MLLRPQQCQYVLSIPCSPVGHYLSLVRLCAIPLDTGLGESTQLQEGISKSAVLVRRQVTVAGVFSIRTWQGSFD